MRKSQHIHAICDIPLQSALNHQANSTFFERRLLTRTFCQSQPTRKRGSPRSFRSPKCYKNHCSINSRFRFSMSRTTVRAIESKVYLCRLLKLYEKKDLNRPTILDSDAGFGEDTALANSDRCGDVSNPVGPLM